MFLLKYPVNINQSLTFRRIDLQRGPVQTLLIPPVGVSHERLRRHYADEDRRRQQHRSAARFGPVSSRYPIASGHRGADDQAGAHAGQVQYPLGYDEAHVEEQIARRQEREHEEAQGDGEGGGRRLSSANVDAAVAARPLGTVTIAERTVVIVVGRPAAVGVTAAGASTGAHRTPGRRGDARRISHRRRVTPTSSQTPDGPESGADQGAVQAHRF